MYDGSTDIARGGRGADFLTPISYELDPQRDGSFDREQLWNFMWEMRLEPAWRAEAEVEMAFYDGDQLKTDILRRMKELGMAPIVVNMVAPAIDSVAGWETIARADLMCVPATEESYATATGLNVKFKEALRMTRFNTQVGYQFKDAIKIGLSWLEVSRNPDPFGYPYRVGIVPWREMYTDYRSREQDYGDARYMLRRKWYDRDELVHYFPKHRDLIRNVAFGEPPDGWAYEWEALNQGNLADDLAHFLEQETRFTLEEDEWRQRTRNRGALYEILYWVPETVECLRLRDGRVVQLDPESELHLMALQKGMAQYVRGVTKVWRQAFYIGPHRLADRPLRLNRPHYVPMVAYRKDNDGAPYGLIRRMKSAQEAYNARQTRMIYDTTSRKYKVDDDAVDDHKKTAAELNKVNSYVVTRGDRRGEDGISQLPTLDTTPITYQLMQENKLNIFDVTGLHPEFQGRTMEAGRSGIAIETLIEQTSQVLGPVVDNYRNGKKKAGELLLGMIIDDIKDLDDYEVETDEKTDGRRRKILLNARRADDERDNDILLARIEVALSEAPASVTYQQQKFQSLTEIIKAMPEQYQVVMMDLVVRAASLPDGEEMLERIRKLTGYGPEPKDPEEREALRQQMAQEQAVQQKLQEIEMMLAEAELLHKQAQAAHDKARADKAAGVDSDLTEAKAIHELAKADLTREEQDRKDTETRAKLVEASARLEKERNADRDRAEKAKAAAKAKPAK